MNPQTTLSLASARLERAASAAVRAALCPSTVKGEPGQDPGVNYCDVPPARVLAISHSVIMKKNQNNAEFFQLKVISGLRFSDSNLWHQRYSNPHWIVSRHLHFEFQTHGIERIHAVLFLSRNETGAWRAPGDALCAHAQTLTRGTRAHYLTCIFVSHPSNAVYKVC